MSGKARGALRASLRVETIPGPRVARYPLSARLSANRPIVIGWSASEPEISSVRREPAAARMQPAR
jgi:hypothetical protein